ncbi:MAG: beta-propeller fold lactonase family protein [Oligoflexia bacterium]|nr:beta-propeller fold lactonase family protein [Oligoflexia bacterium]
MGKITYFINLISISLLTGLFGIACTNGNFETGSSSGGSVLNLTYFVHLGRNSALNSNGYLVDKTNGSLSSSGTWSCASGVSVNVIAATPSNKFLYCGASDNRIYMSMLTNLSTGTFGTAVSAAGPLPSLPSSMTVTANGRFLLVTAGSTIYTWTIDSSTGLLSNIQNLATGSSRFNVTASPIYDVVLATTSNTAPTNNIYSYTINSTTGALTYASAMTTQDGADQVQTAPVFHPTADYFYLGTNGATFSVQSFSISSSGAITQVNKYNPGSTTDSVAMDPFGRFLFVALNSNDIATFTISGGGSVLSPTSTLSTGIGDMWYMVTDHLGQNLYVADPTASVLRRYPYNGSGTVSLYVQNFTALSNISGLIFFGAPL